MEIEAGLFEADHAMSTMWWSRMWKAEVIIPTMMIQNRFIESEKMNNGGGNELSLKEAVSLLPTIILKIR